MGLLSPLATLRRWMTPGREQQRHALSTGGTEVADPAIPLFRGEPIPRYPDRGIAAPAAPPDMLMESQVDLINQLHQASSFSYGEFDNLIMPAIRNYAAYAHLLPASETNHHCGQGGLFRHGLEVACNAAIACESKVFAMDRWASERHHLTPRWRLCAILGGMVHDMGKPLIDVGAVDASGELLWNPHTGSLWDWLQEHHLDHYYIHWRPGARFKRHEAFNTLALYRIVPPQTLKWIGQFGGQEAFDALVMALTGSPDPRNPLSALIRQADSKSVDRDLKDSRARLSASGMGGKRSLAAQLVRAMHDAIEAGTWQINKLGSPVWVTTEGVFGMHPAVLREAIAALREQGETGLPTDIAQALDLLADWGYLHANVHPDGQSTNTWNLRIHAVDRGKPTVFDAHVVRFAREEIIPSAVLPPTPLVAQLLGPDGQPHVSGQMTPGGTEAVVPAALASIDQSPDASPTNAASAPVEEVVLRDRGQEEDARTVQMEEALAHYHAPFPPTTPEDALAWLSDPAQQPEGSVLVQIAKRVQDGVYREGLQVFDEHQRIHLRSPDAFQELGWDAVELRTRLEAKGWTETDSPTVQRTTVWLERAGKRIPCTRLTDGLSIVFRLLLPAREITQALSPAATKANVMGPCIDADTATRLRNRDDFDAADGPLIRPILHDYLVKFAREQGRRADQMGSEELHMLLGNFARTHRIRKLWWVQHVLQGNPSVCTSQDAARAGDSQMRHDLRFNPDYNPAIDRQLAEQEAIA